MTVPVLSYVPNRRGSVVGMREVWVKTKEEETLTGDQGWKERLG